MRRSYFIHFIFLFLLTSFSLLAQEKELEGPWLFNRTLSLENGGFVVIKQKPENPTTGLLVEVYTPAAKLQATSTIDLVRRNLLYEMEDIFVWKDKLALFTSVYKPGPKTQDLLIERYNLSDLAFVDGEVLGETRPLELMEYYNSSFTVSLSPDQSKFLLLGRSPSSLEDVDPMPLLIRVLDADLNFLRKEKIILPYINNSFSIDQSSIDNQGNFYLLAYIYTGKISNFHTIVDHKFDKNILAFSANSSKPKEFRLTMPEKLILQELSINLDKEENLILFSQVRKKFSGTTEYLNWYKINAEKNIFQSRSLNITEGRFVNSYLGNLDKQPKNIHRFLDYQLHKSEIDPRNQLLVTLRCFDEGKDELIFIRVSKEGRLQNFHRLPLNGSLDNQFRRVEPYFQAFDKGVAILYNEIVVRKRQNLPVSDAPDKKIGIRTRGCYISNKGKVFEFNIDPFLKREDGLFVEPMSCVPHINGFVLLFERPAMSFSNQFVLSSFNLGLQIQRSAIPWETSK